MIKHHIVSVRYTPLRGELLSKFEAASGAGLRFPPVNSIKSMLLLCTQDTRSDAL